MTPSVAGQIGAHTRWGKTPDWTAATAQARRAATSKWLREVQAEFPDLGEAAQRQMADSRRRAHIIRIAQLPRRR
ncbi:hypothetical protein F8280_18815 [Micromonospora noduli]|uniref:hypothetical protein n=1 Tax=Micromonospora noduli TaxID=709876 RepID=UPI00124B2477|nr:hypothetical protein [Micromonospora noduli]KAB1922509.1 hypothetical protein F8280_18815 [Micromonospora noduli]